MDSVLQAKDPSSAVSVMGAQAQVTAKEASNTRLHLHSYPAPPIYTYLSSEGRGDQTREERDETGAQQGL